LAQPLKGFSKINIMRILSILAITISFLQCGSAKLENNVPFKIVSSTSSSWFGGVQGISGTQIEIRINKATDIVFDSLYFNNKATKLKITKSGDSTILIGHFNTSNEKEADFILNSDRKKELKNPIPKIKRIPFEIKKNQAILSYKIANSLNYFKIEKIEEIKTLFYPQIKQP
jgi:hypothetical protein